MEQSQPQVIQTEAPQPASAMPDVIVPAAQCVAAGLGAGLVAGIVANHLGYAFGDCVAGALTTAGIVTGLALFWHFAWSVAHEDWEWEKLLLAVDNQDDEINTLRTQLSTMSRDLIAAQHEAKVQSILRNAKDARNYTPAESELDPVRQNAKKMIDYWLATASHPSRRKMEDVMSQGDYAAALSYLQVKGALVINGSQVTWKVNSVAQGELVLA